MRRWLWIVPVFALGWLAATFRVSFATVECQAADGGAVEDMQVQVEELAAEVAKGGEILVSDVVSQLAKGKDLLFADRGEVTPKGFDEPVRLYELRWQE